MINLPMTAIVQARMGSTRFPGKTLHPLLGKPLLHYLLERLKRTGSVGRVIIATSIDPTDDPLAVYCADHEITCHRSDLKNVAKRFEEIVKAYELPAFIRLSGDSPLLDPAIIDSAVRHFQEGSWDIVTNISPRSYPRGQSVEILDTRAFLRAFHEMRDPADCEHVTPYFYSHSESFKIYRMERAGPNTSTLHLAVDSPDDLKRIESLITGFGPKWVEAGLEQILQKVKAYV